MRAIADAVCVTLLILATIQGVMVLRLWWTLRRNGRPVENGQPLPRAAVVLAVRGPDPFLAKCLTGLLEQDYPDYEVFIVVDCLTDPAWEVVSQVVADCGVTHATVRHLETPRKTCSLKCSSLVQAISELEATHEVVAFIDADVLPHRTWLRELVAPLADPTVGATTGNRWYLPQNPNWGSVVRSAWNVGAVVQMLTFRIAWGGSLAIRHSTLLESGLLDKWVRSFNDDIVLGAVVQKMNLKLQFVPSLLMVNHESCRFRELIPWVRRQLVPLRLYHTQWPGLVCFGLTVLLTMLAGAVCLVASIFTGDVRSAWPVLVGGAGYFGLFVLVVEVLNRTVSRMVSERTEAVHCFHPRSFIAVPAAQFVFLIALMWAVFARQLGWRGVTYRIAGPWDVKLLDYRPYQAHTKAADATVSL